MEKDKIVFKGSHPDSLYRVPVDSGARTGKLGRALRIMRWPVALVVVCVALAVFVYFLMPDNFRPIETGNGTYWESNVADANTHRSPDRTVYRPEARNPANANQNVNPITEPRTPEIDFYDAENNKNDGLRSGNSVIANKTSLKKMPVPPVYPTHLTPEVQYGNENADTGNLRSPKILHQANAVSADSTLKPHITQKPEKPLAIYFKDGEGVTTTKAINYSDKISNKEHEDDSKNNKHYSGMIPKPTNTADFAYDTEPVLPPEIQEYYPRMPFKTHVNFTSGHSKLFGISIEDAEKMQSTTQSSVYNTRVSPTLPTWRDGDDTTTKKYPVNANHDVSRCRSTSLPLCRGVLPYDLASPPTLTGGASVKSLLPHIEYVASTNCSSRFKSFVCALLEPECSPLPLLPKKPCYNFCKAIADSCEGEFPRELEAMFTCEQYSSHDCVGARAPCSVRELACGDGSCVPREWICNGRSDCPAGEDEGPCHNCENHEFRCSSGMCIHKRWVCDGYADCPDADDEAAAECGAAGPDLGDQAAGSAPAPAVHKPNKLSRLRANTGDIESSKELLITSESSNAVKRNFTRRPPLSRLTPYSHAMRQNKEKNVRAAEVELQDEVQKNNNARHESKEDINVDDLGFFSDIGEGKGQQSEVKPVNKSKPNPLKGRAPPPPPPDAMGSRTFDEGPQPTQQTKLDKTINKLELVLDGASLIKKASQSDTATEIEYQDSVENTTTFVRPETKHVPEKPKTKAASSVVKQSAHASPCPSGELRCVDGRCITLAQLCDGSIDCSDHADEDNCYT